MDASELAQLQVAPLAGAWIETVGGLLVQTDVASRPSRARGLKLGRVNLLALPGRVAPLAGAWIETSSPIDTNAGMPVAPLAGAWIETGFPGGVGWGAFVAPLAGAWIETVLLLYAPPCAKSRPSRARGLKRALSRALVTAGLVAPLAGAWIETKQDRAVEVLLTVAPLAGAWIETRTKHTSFIPSRTVAPLAGAWIETCRNRSESASSRSRAPRGRVD